jgi:ABC-type branched-subunit amino acid transport system ATPase component
MLIFEASDLCKNFGGLKAVNHISFKIETDRISGFIGPNGAGKTTLFNLMTGFLKVDNGQCFFKSTDITNWSPHRIMRKGMARSWQQVRLFDELTVLENILVALPKSAGDNPIGALIPWRNTAARRRSDTEKAISYLEFVGLANAAHKNINDISHPEQKLVSMARLLATEAEFLLLDEPMSGLDMKVLENTLVPLINKLATHERKTICIIEHSIDIIRKLCNWLFFLSNGQLIAEGTPQELLNNPELARIYFGSGKITGHYKT